MFIVSKRNYIVRRADGSTYLIEKDYIGDIPDDVAESSLVRRAVRAGMIFSPSGHGDKQLEEADHEAEKKARENDVRPDAEKKADETDEPEDIEMASSQPVGKRNAKK